MKQKIFFLLILWFTRAFTERVDQIENGVIESHSTNLSLFSVKCNKHSQLNSNASLVYQTNINNTIKWLPVNGYLYSHLPLCMRVCRFQSRLTNGLIKIDSLVDAKNSSKQQQSIYYVDLIESSKIKYECSDGYYLRVIPNSKQQQAKINIAKGRKYLIEKCHSNGIEEFVQLKRKMSKSKSNSRHDYVHNFDEYYEYNSQEEYDYYSDNNLDTFIPSSTFNNLNEKRLYECVRYCKPLKTISISYGYLVPSKSSNIQFSPGEQVKYYCKEGYITDLTKTFSHVSNMHTLECTTNGTWNLIVNSNRFPSILFKQSIEYLTECNPIDLFYKSNDNYKSDSYLTYSELNMRTFTMIFAICGLIILILLTSLLTLKLLKRKHNDLVFNNLSPQLDPLLTTNNDANSTLPEYTLRSRTIASTAATTSAHLSASELPTYQEALSQPTFLPTNHQSILISSNTDRINNLNEQNNKSEEQQSNMNRSGSVRSNLTTRSANGSIRTTNSIATTNSVGNASFNIPLPHRSTRSASKHNQNSRSTNKRHASNKTTTRSTNSAISEACTVLTTTNMSLMSNETNASIKALRGSSSGVDLVSTNSIDSSTSINNAVSNTNAPINNSTTSNNNNINANTSTTVKTESDTLVSDDNEQNSTIN